MATTLGAVAESSIVYLNESGVATPFYVAKHNYESALNGAGRTLLVRRDAWPTAMAWDAGSVNAYSGSDVDVWLNGTYKAVLDGFVQTAMATTMFYYTPGNGNTTVATIARAVFLLSLTELGRSDTNANIEGAALPIASALRPVYVNGVASEQWTRTPRKNNTWAAFTITATGSVGSSFADSSARPCFTLPEETEVDSNNNIIDGTGDAPSETYTKLESITSSGTQYINTGFKPNNNTRVVADVSISSSKTTQALFGGRTSTNTTSGAMFAVFTTNTTTVRSDYNGAYTQTLTCPRDTRVTIDKNKETTTVNGNSASYTNASFQSAATLTIFALNENGTIESGTMAAMTLYSFKIYDNGTLVRDYVPARRNSDGAIGLLDQVNNVFYGNAGAGTFVAGPEIVSTGSLANIGGTSVPLTGCIANVGGVEYVVPYALVNVNGVEYTVPFDMGPDGTPLSEYTEGDIVYLNENGSPVEFYVSKHNYESALNGAGRTLLVRKYIHSTQSWGKGNNAYAGNTMDLWLNSTWITGLDDEVQMAAQSTKFYYTPGNGNNSVTTLERAAFLLSVTELGMSDSETNVEGTALPIHNALRPALFNGANYAQYTRTPSIEYYLDVAYITSSGTSVGIAGMSSRGARPCITLPGDRTYVDDTGLVIAFK